MDLKILVPSPPPKEFYEMLTRSTSITAFDRFGDVFRERLEHLYGIHRTALEDGKLRGSALHEILNLMDSCYLDIEPFASIESTGTLAKEFLINCSESIEYSIKSFTRYELHESHHFDSWKPAGDSLYDMWIYTIENINDGVIDRYMAIVDCLKDVTSFAHDNKTSRFNKSLEIYQWEMMVSSEFIMSCLSEMDSAKSLKNSYYGQSYYKESAVKLFGNLNRIFDSYIGAFLAVPHNIRLSSRLSQFPSNMENRPGGSYQRIPNEKGYRFWSATGYKKEIEAQRDSCMAELLRIMKTNGITEYSGTPITTSFRI